MSIQQHLAYHQGFYDAQDGEPIWFDECSPEYAAGWIAFWDCRLPYIENPTMTAPKPARNSNPS
jgi:hypothetical protein